MAQRRSGENAVVLYANIWTTLLMLVFFLFREFPEDSLPAGTGIRQTLHHRRDTVVKRCREW